MSELLTADKLVVSQKAKLIELVNQYSIHDGEGGELGFIQQEGQSKKRKARSCSSPSSGWRTAPAGRLEGSSRRTCSGRSASI